MKKTRKVNLSRYSFAMKTIAVFLVISFLNQLFYPSVALALSGGPSAPEFTTFEAATTTEMVDLFTGDFKYNINLFDVDGYPVNLSYTGEVGMEQEASWVGLGWNLNPGMVNRTIRGIPDDFKGETIKEWTSRKKEKRMSLGISIMGEVAGYELGADAPILEDLVLSGNIGLNLNHSTKRGFSIGADGGLGIAYAPTSAATGFNEFMLGTSLGLSVGGEDGVAINPGVDFSTGVGNGMGAGLEAGIGYNSRSGYQNFSYGLTVGEWKESAKTCKMQLNKHYTLAGGSVPLAGRNTYFPHARPNTRSLGFAIAGKVGSSVLVTDGSVSFRGYYYEDAIPDNEELVESEAYGYYNLQNAHDNPAALLDFNKDGDDNVFYPGMDLLPPAVLTYDIYNVVGQGFAGSIRPKRMETGAFSDPQRTPPASFDLSLSGGEMEPGSIVKMGLDVSVGLENMWIGTWDQVHTKYGKFDANPLFSLEQNVLFIKGIQAGQMNESYYAAIGNKDPMAFSLSDAYSTNLSTFTMPEKNQFAGSDPFQRIAQDEMIQVLITEEAATAGLDKQIKFYNTAYDLTPSAGPTDYVNHHVRQITATKNDGSRYVYGIPVRNITKQESTFNCSGGTITQPNLIEYQPGSDNSALNDKGDNHLYHTKQIPQYAYGYLITGYLGADYIDVGDNGITDDDIGMAVKFNWRNTHAGYQWRMPMTSDANVNRATLNPGSNLSDQDQNGIYSYGTKEMCYLHSIVTKNHIAFFEISARKDGRQAEGEHGGIDESGNGLYKLDKIKLYSKEHWEAQGANATPIKVIEFEYNYSLCQNTPNSTSSMTGGDGGDKGKLTLKKLYIYSGKNTGGQLSPYVFEYAGSNPGYSYYKTDRWGNYKSANPSPFGTDAKFPDFPYVNEYLSDAQVSSDASAWQLTQIVLPSGGKISVEYESDEYAWVQDKPAQMMYQIRGVGSNSDYAALGTLHDRSVKSSEDYMYLYIDNPYNSGSPNYVGGGYTGSTNVEDLVDRDEMVYFRVRMEIPSRLGQSSVDDKNFEYIRGYFEPGAIGVCANDPSKLYVEMLPVAFNDKGKEVNPMLKAGLDYTYANHQSLIFGSIDPDNGAIVKAVKNIIAIKDDILSMFVGPYKTMLLKKMCSSIEHNGSGLLRLKHPEARKKGGGIRVKSIVMSDQWSLMNTTGGSNAYYGQTYSYDYPDGSTSGVATYEPDLGNDENPFKRPHYYETNNSNSKKAEPAMYQEEPMGEMFYPPASVGYGYVRVESINQESKSDRTYSIHQFYTAKDFPLEHEVTPIDYEENFEKPALAYIGYGVTEVAGATSQGHVMVFNDMHGKPESEEHFVLLSSVGSDVSISKTEYFYNTDSQGKLDNEVECITRTGEKVVKTIGVTADVDIYTKASELTSERTDAQGNVYFIPAPPIPFPLPIPALWPSDKSTVNRYRTAVVTKVIQQTGILKQIKHTDRSLQTTVTNEIFDEQSGGVLLTSTTTEYDSRRGDVQYQTTIPSYFAREYDRMGYAYRNADYQCIPDPTIDFLSAADYNPATDRDDLMKIIYKGYLDGIEVSLYNGGTLYGNQVPAGVFIEGDEVLAIDESGTNQPLVAYVAEVVTEEDLDAIYALTGNPATNPLGDPTPGSTSGSGGGGGSSGSGTLPTLCGDQVVEDVLLAEVYSKIVALSQNAEAQNAAVLANISNIDEPGASGKSFEFMQALGTTSYAWSASEKFFDIWAQSWSQDYFEYCRWMLSNDDIRAFFNELNTNEDYTALVEVLQCPEIRACLTEDVESSVILTALDFLTSDYNSGSGTAFMAAFFDYLALHYTDHYFVKSTQGANASPPSCNIAAHFLSNGTCDYTVISYYELFEDINLGGFASVYPTPAFSAPCDILVTNIGNAGFVDQNCSALGTFPIDMGDLTMDCPQLTAAGSENNGSTSGTGTGSGKNVVTDPQDYDYNEPQKSELVMFVTRAGALTDLEGWRVRVIRSGRRNLHGVGIQSLTSYNIHPYGSCASDAYPCGYVQAAATLYSDEWTSDFMADGSVNGEFNPFVTGHRGIFKSHKTYAPKGYRAENATLNARSEGILESFTPFWEIDATTKNLVTHADEPAGWVLGERMSQHSLSGAPIESFNALDLPSCELVGLNNQIVAAAVNARHREVLFESFEHYAYGSGLYRSNCLIDANGNHAFAHNGTGTHSAESLSVTGEAHSGKRAMKLRGSVASGNSSYDNLPIYAQWSIDAGYSGSGVYNNEEYRVLGFRPTNNDFVISMWVKVADPSLSAYSPENTIATVEISATDASSNPVDVNGSEPGTARTLTPSGNMIDGWMRIEGVFNAPGSVKTLKVKISGGSHGAFVDDVRIYPDKATFKSFVYDNENHRLVCILDENNYGTFYRYDEDGKLKKMEQETVNGRLTVKQSLRSNARL